MNEYFKLTKIYEGQEITLLIYDTPEDGGAQVIPTGEIVDFRGKLFFVSMFKRDEKLEKFFGATRVKNDNLESLKIESTENDFMENQYANFLIAKEDATEINEHQLKVILKVIDRKMNENQ